MAWKAYKKFVTQQSVTEFTAEFEKEYKKANNCRCNVSDTVLANTLLEACKLSDTNEKFILTAVDLKIGKENKVMLTQVISVTYISVAKLIDNASRSPFPKPNELGCHVGLMRTR